MLVFTCSFSRQTAVLRWTLHCFIVMSRLWEQVIMNVYKISLNLFEILLVLLLHRMEQLPWSSYIDIDGFTLEFTNSPLCLILTLVWMRPCPWKYRYFLKWVFSFLHSQKTTVLSKSSSKWKNEIQSMYKSLLWKLYTCMILTGGRRSKSRIQ